MRIFDFMVLSVGKLAQNLIKFWLLYYLIDKLNLVSKTYLSKFLFADVF